jgi:hypothetical protein
VPGGQRAAEEIRAAECAEGAEEEVWGEVRNMERETFQRHLGRGAEASRQKTLPLVTNTLPPSNRYYVRLNCSFDGNPLHQKEKVFPDHNVPQTDQTIAYSESEIVERLWRDGFVPVWINIKPYAVDKSHTYFELICAGRFTNEDSDVLYHRKEGYPPFHAGVVVPPNWTPKSPKFDLHHHRDRRKKNQ